jgi:hypothetical protein
MELRGRYLHIAMPRKYKPISGTAIPIMLDTSAGVRIIEMNAMTRIATRHCDE